MAYAHTPKHLCCAAGQAALFFSPFLWQLAVVPAGFQLACLRKPILETTTAFNYAHYSKQQHQIWQLTRPGASQFAALSCRGDQYPGCLVQHHFPGSLCCFCWISAAVFEEVFPTEEAAVTAGHSSVCLQAQVQHLICLWRDSMHIWLVFCLSFRQRLRVSMRQVSDVH